MNNQLILILLIFIIIYLFIKNSNACSNFHRNEREEFDVGAKLKKWQVGVGALTGVGLVAAGYKTAAKRKYDENENENENEWEKLRDAWIEKYFELFGVDFHDLGKVVPQDRLDHMKDQYKNQLVPFTHINQVTIKLPIEIYTKLSDRLSGVFVELDKTKKLVIGTSDKTIELAINAMKLDNTSLRLKHSIEDIGWTEPMLQEISAEKAIEYYDKAYSSLNDDFLDMMKLYKDVAGVKNIKIVVEDNMGIKAEKIYDSFQNLFEELSSQMKSQLLKYKDRADSIHKQYHAGQVRIRPSLAYTTDRVDFQGRQYLNLNKYKI